MKKLLIGILALSSFSASASECYYYIPLEKTAIPTSLINADVHGTVESYLQRKNSDNTTTLKLLLDQRVYGPDQVGLGVIEVTSVSGKTFQGCETQVAALGNGDNWGSIMNLSSFRATDIGDEPNLVCTYSSASGQVKFAVCKP